MITRLILAIGWCWTIGCLAASGGEAVAQKTNLISNHGIQLPRTLPLSGYGLVPALGGLRFGNPVVIACPPGETNRLFLAERAGRVLVVTNLTEPTATVFLDVRVRTYSTYPEAGLLGLTFHPGFGTNGYFYVFRSLIRDTAGHPNALHEQVSRFSASPIDPNQALVDSELVLIAQPDHSPEHNGGDLKFGPDGYLYISFGNNGPSPNDRSEQVQPIDGGFFGAIARIDVDQRPENLRPNLGPATSPFYSIPRDNPFVGVHEHEGVTVDPAKVRTEFYAIGLRNPWRMSFDPVTGSLFCGDVGASAWEEINLIRKGGNYGWPYLEGNDGEVPQGLMTNPPLWTYPHGYNSQQGIAVIGGLVCQDASLPALEGAYVFGDYGSGSVWSLRVNTLQRTASNWEYLTSEPGICAFGTDPSTGQILVANHTKGTIQKLVYQSPDAGMAIPQTLYQTGLFTDLIQLQPRAGMIPYQVNAPFWSDQALKSRWFCLPEGTQIQFRPDSNWEFPPGTVWVKHFELELTNGVAASRRRMETRVLVKTPDDVYGLTYRWGRTLDRPTLAPVAGLDEELLIDDGGTTRTQTWHYPSRVQCLGCHTAQGGFALGFNTAQLNLAANSTPAGNQLNYLNSLGCFENLPVLDSSRLPHLAATAATNSPLGHRARSYLTANCSYCHQPGAPAGQSWDARITTPLPLARMINTPASPLPSTLISPVWFLAPRSPEASMILQWMNRRGPLQMPPLATTLVDSNGVQLLTEWIDSFAPDPWQESVIGTPRIQGYTACQNGSFVLSASGGGSYEAADGLYFLSTGLEGSGQILTRLVSFNAAAADAKSGLICRTGLDPEDPSLALLQSGDGALYLERRKERGSPMERRLILPPGPAPWLRILWQDSNLSAFCSADGTGWSVAETLPVPGSSVLHLGLAVVPSDLATFSTAVFDHLEFVSARLAEPVASSPFISPGVISMKASVVSSGAGPVHVEFLSGMDVLGAVSDPRDQFLWRNPPAGSFSLRARVTDTLGAAVLSDPVVMTVQLDRALAHFQQQDAGTLGNWKGVYGSQGYWIPGLEPFLPPPLTLEMGAADTVVLPQSTSAGTLQTPDGSGRLASFWSASGELALRLSLNDAQLHQVALYFADFQDSNRRAQRIQLFDATTGTLLSDQTVEGFLSGQYLVWWARGDIRIQISSLTELPAVLSGVFLGPCFNRRPTVRLHSLPWQTARLPLQPRLEAEAADADGAIAHVDFLDGSSVLGSAFQGPYALTWRSPTVGRHQITARAWDDLGDSVDSEPVQVEFESAPSSAQFVGTDPLTAANWKARYSRFVIPAVLTNWPATVPVTVQNGDVWVWESSSDSALVLENPADAPRTAAAWSGDRITLRLDCLDGYWHQIALYFLDWATGGRIQQVSLLDPLSLTVLDTRAITGFEEGQYYIWNIQGPVLIDIQAQTVNAVLSGLFSEPVAPISPLLKWLPGPTRLTASLGLRGPPGRSVALNFSTDLKNWSVWTTHLIPESGILLWTNAVRSDLTPGFYQAQLQPQP